MSVASHNLRTRCAQLQAALRDAPLQPQPGSALIVTAIEVAREAMRADHPALARQILEVVVKQAPADAQAWQLLGFALGREQCISDAARAFACAAKLEPQEPVTASAHARATLDAGFPAAALFAHAHGLRPDDLTRINGWAMALASEHATAAADALLTETLSRHPGWIEGHKTLAALRFVGGDPLDHTRSYRLACAQEPQNMALRLAWFSVAAQARDWEKARTIIGEGEQLIGAVPAFSAARAIIAGESGDLGHADALFSHTADLRDDALRIAHLRHCLRTAQVEKAETLAFGLLQSPSAPGIWPYLSLIWRIRGDPRAEWLDGAPPYLRVFDLDYSTRELEDLAAVLRRLHTAQRPFVEQSVRGGTQTDTDRQLFFRAEPEIAKVRTKVCTAIRAYVSELPHVPGHPLLGVPRNRLLFSGSWSVRLTGNGFHVSHTHPRGWISSALYISLPADLGTAPAGWISFGAAPPGLGLKLPPYAQLQPKPGRLILFPSTMWHETVPFDDGERLVIAFDVMRPHGSS